jgi:hypothetical protein
MTSIRSSPWGQGACGKPGLSIPFAIRYWNRKEQEISDGEMKESA